MSKKESSQFDESASSTERRIRKKFNVYMSPTSQLNPFGANSSTSTRQEKLTYKYNLMKEYIKLTKRDTLNKQYEQSRYIGLMILGFVGGYFAALALTTVFQRGRNLKSNVISFWDPFVYPIFMTSGFAYEYMSVQERYDKNVSWYILNKYLPQAIENGFQDYTISK